MYCLIGSLRCEGVVNRSRVINDFRLCFFVGEGLYVRVYYGVLKND